MTPAPGEAVAASVLFLRLRPDVDATLPASAAGERLAAAARAALRACDDGQRVVLQAPAGLAIVAGIAPSTALDAASRAWAERGDLPLAIGLHHGPVHASGSRPHRARVGGEALEVAAALAGAGGGHPVVASQAFRDALAAEAPRAAEGLQPLGDAAGPELRAHGPHLYDPAAARQRDTRRALLGAGGIAVLLGAGWIGRLARERYEAARRPAVLVLDIRPSGEVFVDGESRGMAPPLARLSVPPGLHTIEVRNPRAKTLRLELDLQPGEERQLRHVFAMPPPRRPQPKPQPGPFDRFKFW